MRNHFGVTVRIALCSVALSALGGCSNLRNTAIDPPELPAISASIERNPGGRLATFNRVGEPITLEGEITSVTVKRTEVRYWETYSNSPAPSELDDTFTAPFRAALERHPEPVLRIADSRHVRRYPLREIETVSVRHVDPSAPKRSGTVLLAVSAAPLVISGALFASASAWDDQGYGGTGTLYMTMGAISAGAGVVLAGVGIAILASAADEAPKTGASTLSLELGPTGGRFKASF
jgi:hypothetical protein